jgi:periplasmic protein TonB
MNTKPTLRWDDVVFENRNKMYGAYTIRQSYHSNLSRGTAAAFAFFAVMFFGSQAILNLGNHASFIPKPPTGIILDPPPQIISEVKIEKPTLKPPPAIRDLPPRVVTQEVPDIPIVDPAPSVPVSNDVGNVNGLPSVGENTIGTNVPVVIEQTPTVDIAEVMPEFEGGLKALYKFLNKNLRYPSIAQRTGLEGTVYVRFVVDTEGSVTNIEVMRGVSGILDKEASRVISLLPKWKPGMQHNRPVNVRMMMPIKFELGE